MQVAFLYEHYLRREFMYEAPKLERFGNFRELTLDDTKVFPVYDSLVPYGTNDGFQRS